MTYALDLSKSQKKIARQIVETGLDREFKNGITEIDRVIQQWKDGKTETRDTYYKMYKSLIFFDKKIGRRYNNMKGSTYLIIIAGQLADGIITRGEIDEFDVDIKAKIFFLSGIGGEQNSI